MEPDTRSHTGRGFQGKPALPLSQLGTSQGVERMTNERIDADADYGAAINLWKVKAREAWLETGEDEKAAIELMNSWVDEDPKLGRACDMVVKLIGMTELLDEFGMKKEAREIRGYLGTGPQLKVIPGGKT